jgi:hypothetical protein
MGRGITFETVRAIGLAMSGVAEGTAYGAPALKVAGQMFACVPSHKSAEPNSLAVRMDFDRRDELLAADPATYYVKPHYMDYPCVLVRLDHVDKTAVRDLLLIGCRFVSSKGRRPTPRRRTPATRRPSRRR